MSKPFPAYEGNAGYVFVCYSHADREAVYPELICLRDAGLNVWYDEGISPGVEWSDAIADRIDGADAFLYFVTPRSVNSAHCRREVSFALERPRRMVTVHLEPTELPRGLRLMLNNLQAILRYEHPSDYLPKLVRALQPGAQSEPQRDVGAVPNARVAVAVTPFTLRNVGTADEFLSVALADAVIHQLSSVGQLIVRPITSVLAYKDADADWATIARELNVEIIVQGVVQMQGTKVRALTEVFSVAERAQLHSFKHDGDVGDLFAWQDRIADAVANVFAPRRTTPSEPRKSPTKDPRAYELYLRAIDRIAYVDKFDMEIAIETLTRVVGLDPNFADAWGRLADALTQMGSHLDADPKWFARAEDAIAKTLALDPVQCDALCARSRVLWSAPRGFQNRPALRAINAALQINPNSDIARTFRGVILFHLGFYQQAASDLENALLTSPGYVLPSTSSGLLLTYRGDFERAHEAFERALHLNPAHLHANLFSPAPLIYLGRLDEARDRIEKARLLLPEEPELLAMEGLILASEGDFKKAEALADRAASNPSSMTHTHHTWHDAAGVYALCGKTEKALLELWRCAEMGLPNSALFRSDPHLRGLRNDRDFQALLATLERSRNEFREEFGLTE